MMAFSGLANSVLTVTASGKHIIANAGTAIAGRIFGNNVNNLANGRYYI